MASTAWDKSYISSNTALRMAANPPINPTTTNVTTRITRRSARRGAMRVVLLWHGCNSW